MVDVTVCIPIGPYHVDISKSAIMSVRMQTVQCHILTLQDENGKGPGWARNRLAEAVKTKFLVFLDADDELMPTFVEECLRVYKDRYVYTDWYNDDGDVKNSPDCAWSNNTWHLITTLLPLEFHNNIGGFNESLPGLEDTEYYLRMTTSGLCGKRLGMPLVHYTKNGRRSREAKESGLESLLKSEFVVKYGGKKMACCDDQPQVVVAPGGKSQGDVLARTKWYGNHTELGRATGRIYPRSGNGRLMWVNPRDIAASPHLWEQVEQSLEPEPPPPIVEIKPDVARVIRLSQKVVEDLPPIAETRSDITFAFADDLPPSYYDIFALCKLSNFNVCRISDINPLDDAPVIIVTPFRVLENNPEIIDAPRRVIFWQLEYAGDYIDNYEGLKGEMWASDPKWAKDNGAKYVLLGSHPSLRTFNGPVNPEKEYDVTMLGYMVGRRQQIKDQLSNLNWPVDYPGHYDHDRASVLEKTKLMLHVHQHDNANYYAPQRLAIAAAYHMPVISENVYEQGEVGKYVTFSPYDRIPDTVTDHLKAGVMDDGLFNYLCIENTFRKTVEEALK